MNDSVLIAPRELTDLVYRCARINGCDAGSAPLLARSVTFAQVHGHQGARVFLELDIAATADLIAAYGQMTLGEIQARSGVEVELTFDPPVADALTTLARFEAVRRGAGVVDLVVADGALSSLTLGPSEPIPAVEQANAERQARVELEGLEIDRGLFDELNRRAVGFLVSEAVLDAHT